MTDFRRGPMGPMGPPGHDGPPGSPGKPGVDGRDGRHGRDGAPGRPGRDGRNGIDGKDGADAVLPPLKQWDAEYVRDPDTDLTHHILAGPTDGSAPRIRMDVIRRADSLIERVQLIPI